MPRLPRRVSLALGILSLASGALAGCGGRSAAAPPAAATPSAARAPKTETELARLEQSLARAIRARDSTTLERLLAPGFVLASGSAARPTVTRAAWLRNTLRAIALDSIHASEIAVTPRGDSADVTLWLYWRGRLGGRMAIDESNKLADLWVRRDGAWQVVRRRTLERRPGATQR